MMIEGFQVRKEPRLSSRARQKPQIISAENKSGKNLEPVTLLSNILIVVNNIRETI